MAARNAANEPALRGRPFRELSLSIFATTLVAGLVLALSPAPAVADDAAAKRYWNDTFKFGVRYPADARTEPVPPDEAKDGAVLRLWSADGRTICIFWAVRDASLAGIDPGNEVTLTVMLTLMTQSSLQEQFASKKEGIAHPPSTVRIGGRLARFYETTVFEKTGPVRGRNWITLVPGHFFTVNCAVPAEHFDTPAAQRFMDAIRDGIFFSDKP